MANRPLYRRMIVEYLTQHGRSPRRAVMAHVGSAIDPAQAIRRRERELTKYADSYPTTVPRQVQVGRNLIAGVAIQNALRQGIITRAAADTLELVSAGQCADK